MMVTADFILQGVIGELNQKIKYCKEEADSARDVGAYDRAINRQAAYESILGFIKRHKEN